jgi:uncharacterized protein (DUF2344 family)
VLVARLRNLSAGNFSDGELTRMNLAGLCSTDEFKAILKNGASLRLEVPRAWSYATINTEHCDNQAVAGSPPTP